MKITPLQYAIFLYEMISQDANINKGIKDFLTILFKNNDLGKIKEIIGEFEKYYKKKKGLKEVEIISARPIDKNSIKKLVEAVGIKNQSDIKETIDSNLLGGLIMIIDDIMIDVSLKRKLKELNKSLIYG